jgi:protein kinase A
LDEILKEEALRREEEAKNHSLLGTALRFTKSFTQSFSSTSRRSSSSSSSSAKRVTGIGVASTVEYDLDEFEHIRTLGYGRFGFVKLVRRRQATSSGGGAGAGGGTGGVYALKILFKEPLVALNLHLLSPYVERELLQRFDHPFLPAIYATFQDQHCFYLLLEAIPGGDFWNILYDRQSWTKLEASRTQQTMFSGLQSEIAKFYFSNVLCALEYLHHHEVIYRDLKPENLVMDRTGYLKLVDFGSAKKLPFPQLTNTLCGTPEYLAPEMITAQGHNQAVDYWTLGIFFYELLCGKTPFEHNDMVSFPLSAYPLPLPFLYLPSFLLVSLPCPLSLSLSPPPLLSDSC